MSMIHLIRSLNVIATATLLQPSTAWSTSPVLPLLEARKNGLEWIYVIATATLLQPSTAWSTSLKTVAQLGVVMTLATELAVANTNGQL